MDGIGLMTDDEREMFEERAAIVEYDSGWPRPIAEAEARRALGARRWIEAAVGARGETCLPGQQRPAIGNLQVRPQPIEINARRR